MTRRRQGAVGIERVARYSKAICQILLIGLWLAAWGCPSTSLADQCGDEVDLALAEIDASEFAPARTRLANLISHYADGGDSGCVAISHFYTGLSYDFESDNATSPEDRTELLSLAESSYESALMWKEIFPEASNNLAEVLVRLNRKPEAQALYSALLQDSSLQQSLYLKNAADLNEQLGHWDSAAGQLRQALFKERERTSSAAKLAQLYRENDPERLLPLAWALVDSSMPNAAFDVAVEAMNDTIIIGDRRAEASWLILLVFCQAKSGANPPSGLWVDGSLPSIRPRWSSRLDTALMELNWLLDTVGFDQHDYRWWTTSRHAMRPSVGGGVTGKAALVDMAASIGLWYHNQLSMSLARRYYEFANATCDNTDLQRLEVLMQLSYVLMATEQYDQIGSLIDQGHQQMFADTMTVFTREEDRDIYEYHRSLGIMLSSLETERDPVGGKATASFQLDRALKTVESYNSKAGPTVGDALIPEPRVVRALVKSYERSGHVDRAKQVNARWESVLKDVPVSKPSDTTSPGAPEGFQIFVKPDTVVKPHAYPNPFRISDGASVTFVLLEQPTKLTLMTASGKLVRVWSDASGELVWDGKNQQGQIVDAGTYLWRLQDGEGSGGKIVVIR